MNRFIINQSCILIKLNFVAFQRAELPKSKINPNLITFYLIANNYNKLKITMFFKVQSSN